jgi:hypothetical protein
MTTATETKTIQELIDSGEYARLLSSFPNYMGINLCSVESIAWVRRSDTQLVSMTVNFKPNDDPEYLEQLKINRPELFQ